MVTGRAGWMGMGRGAGRSALGLWPTLAVLLCSFPAGKTQPAGSPAPGLSCASWGPRFSTPPGDPDSHCHGSLSRALHRERWMSERPRGEGTPARAPKNGSEWGRSAELGMLLCPPFFRENGCPGRLLGAPKERRRRGSDCAPGALSPAPRPPVCKPVGCPGVELGALGRSQTSPRPPRPAPTLAHAGEAHGHRLRRVNFCLITFCVAPLFVFIVPESERISELKLKKPICFQ